MVPSPGSAATASPATDAAGSNPSTRNVTGASPGFSNVSDAWAEPPSGTVAATVPGVATTAASRAARPETATGIVGACPLVVSISRTVAKAPSAAAVTSTATSATPPAGTVTGAPTSRARPWASEPPVTVNAWAVTFVTRADAVAATPTGTPANALSASIASA